MSTDPAPSALYLPGLAGPRRAGELPADLDHRLASLYQRAREAWPQLQVSQADFLRHLARHTPASGTLAQFLDTVLPGELYLALASARGDSRAIAALEAHCFDEVDRALRRLNRGNATDDVKQQLRQKLFVTTPTSEARIAEYGGRGELRRWLRAVAMRAGIDATRPLDREVSAEDALLDAVDASAELPELAHLKSRYRAEIRAAFAEAVATLTDRERNFLRQYYLDGVKLEDLAAAYGVHASTVSRSLDKARHALLSKVRRSLMVKLQLSREELDGIVQLVQSQLEVSAQRLLVAEGSGDGSGDGGSGG